MEVVRKYQDCEEITTPMLNEFIEKIVVYEADKSGGRLNRKRSWYRTTRMGKADDD
ncbi:MAG: DUF4368 domain-containing protein [Lachnospiraceae bacterium]|nr:DUF4368 domain-containing protein [Lachnospiraceae bacterium]